MNTQAQSKELPLSRSAARLLLASTLCFLSQAAAQVPGAPPLSSPQTAASAPGQADAPIPQSTAATLDQVQATVINQPGQLSDEEKMLEVLNRFTYGPRPGDLERLRSEGLNRWFGEQMNPQKIDDSELDRRLADYPAMQMPLDRLVEAYPNNQIIRQTMNGRSGVPGGEGERAIYKAQEQRFTDKRKGADAQAAPPVMQPPPLPFDAPALLAFAPEDRFKALLKLTPAQVRALRQTMNDQQKTALVAGLTPHQLEVLAALENPRGLVSQELVQTKLLRDIYSERQLQEVMTDFWLNHFNVYVGKSQDAPYYIVAFARDIVRPRALGHFEDLLVATAASPAMLNYLDNQQSIGPHSDFASPLMRSLRRQPQQKAASGLNENYARELMELHTLGVGGGYTQKDVTEVAKVFTGWTVGASFGGGPPVRTQFDASRHEPGPKYVLGAKIDPNGLREGFQVLHMLATSPQTARFISGKLATRFVCDDPPPALVSRMSVTFLETHGDIRRVLLTMINSPEFFTRTTFRAKVKTPQDYVLSAVRASGADVQSAGVLAASIAELGMPVFGMQTPQGYSMRTDAWNNTAALVSRMNFALALSSNRLAGVRVDWPGLLAPVAGQVDSPAPVAPLATLPAEAKARMLEQKILHMPASDRTRRTILTQMEADPGQQRTSLNQVSGKGSRDPLSALHLAEAGRSQQPTDPQVALAAGLIFGSPEFQRR